MGNIYIQYNEYNVLDLWMKYLKYLNRLPGVFNSNKNIRRFARIYYSILTLFVIFAFIDFWLLVLLISFVAVPFFLKGLLYCIVNNVKSNEKDFYKKVMIPIAIILLSLAIYVNIPVSIDENSTTDYNPSHLIQSPTQSSNT